MNAQIYLHLFCCGFKDAHGDRGGILTRLKPFRCIYSGRGSATSPGSSGPATLLGHVQGSCNTGLDRRDAVCLTATGDDSHSRHGGFEWLLVTWQRQGRGCCDKGKPLHWAAT